MSAKLWWAFDMDEGLLAVARTRRELLHLCDVPPARSPGVVREWHHYAPDSHELVWYFRGEDDAESIFIEHATQDDLAKASGNGWNWALEGVDVPALLRRGALEGVDVSALLRRELSVAEAADTPEKLSPGAQTGSTNHA